MFSAKKSKSPKIVECNVSAANPGIIEYFQNLLANFYKMDEAKKSFLVEDNGKQYQINLNLNKINTFGINICLFDSKSTEEDDLKFIQEAQETTNNVIFIGHELRFFLDSAWPSDNANPETSEKQRHFLARYFPEKTMSLPLSKKPILPIVNCKIAAFGEIVEANDKDQTKWIVKPDGMSFQINSLQTDFDFNNLANQILKIRKQDLFTTNTSNNERSVMRGKSKLVIRSTLYHHADNQAPVHSLPSERP